jgi:multidrug efflux pump subunit AcrA (membrane-fusion protein)
VEVRRGDVVLYRDMTAVYVPAQEESLSFGIADELISAVHVDIGDTVQAGDIVAELDRTHYQNELERVSRDEAWALLNLAQLEKRHALRMEEAGISGSQVDVSSYTNERSSLLTQLETHRIRKEYLQFEDERRVLRAGISGIVTAAVPFSEGMTSTANRNVVTIADQSQSVFMVRGLDIDHMVMGNYYDIFINWEPYVGKMVDAEELGISRVSTEERYLVLVGDEPENVSSRTFATMRLVLDESKDVLYVPSLALKKANARVFVYVLADNIRMIRDVEIGLEGNLITEIVSGLEEGEIVIQE